MAMPRVRSRLHAHNMIRTSAVLLSIACLTNLGSIALRGFAVPAARIPDPPQRCSSPAGLSFLRHAHGKSPTSRCVVKQEPDVWQEPELGAVKVKALPLSGEQLIKLLAAGGVGFLAALAGAISIYAKYSQTTLPVSPAHAGKFAVAGAVACCVSHALATPMDVIKTRQQFDPMRYRCSVTEEALGILATGKQIVAEEGPAALLKGFKATASGYWVQGACKYGLWEVFKACLGYATADGISKVMILVVAAFGADIIASTVLCPFERARIKLVSDPTYATRTFLALSKMVDESGELIKGLYGRGLAATMLKQQTYSIAKLTTFTLVFEALRGRSGWPRLAITLLSSLCAGVTASILSQPGDTLQVCSGESRIPSMRSDCPVDPETGRPPNIFEMARIIGWSGLFTGWRARLLHVEFVVVCQFLCYDTLKVLLGLS